MVLAGLLAGITCFTSRKAVELAAIALLVQRSTAPTVNVNVAEDAAVLVTTMLVTTVVVLVLGCVYSVVADVAAAPR